MRYSYVLISTISIGIRESDVIPTVAQLMENNGDTETNIFVFCRGYHSTRFAMDELYSYCQNTVVAPITCDKARMVVQYLQTRVFFRPVPQTMRDMLQFMGTDFSIVFTDEETTNSDALQFMRSRLRPQQPCNVAGTILEGVFSRKEV